MNDLISHESLFPLIQDGAIKKGLCERVLATECMIPSLHTFFEDTKWLEPCAKIVRSLLPVECRESTRQALFLAHNGSDTVHVQQSTMEVTMRQKSEEKAVEYGYRQLWLYAWRHFPELSGMMPRKDIGRPKPQVQASNERCKYELADLAQTLGFRTAAISDLLGGDPDSRMIRDFLRAIRPMVVDQISDAIVEEVCRLVQRIPHRSTAAVTRSEDDVWADITPDHRHGRPYEISHGSSKHKFFLEEILRKERREFSYFSINRDIFLAFFGDGLGWDFNEVMDDEPSDAGPGQPMQNVPVNNPSAQFPIEQRQFGNLAQVSESTNDNSADDVQMQIDSQPDITQPDPSSTQSMVVHQPQEAEFTQMQIDSQPIASQVDITSQAEVPSAQELIIYQPQDGALTQTAPSHPRLFAEYRRPWEGKREIFFVSLAFDRYFTEYEHWAACNECTYHTWGKTRLHAIRFDQIPNKMKDPKFDGVIWEISKSKKNTHKMVKGETVEQRLNSVDNGQFTFEEEL